MPRTSFVVEPKKVPETDDIFANVHARREVAIQDDECLRISLDFKAKVKIGPFCRGGDSRGLTSVRAADHDMGYDALLVPFGILEMGYGHQAIDQLWMGFGESRETSDFIVNCMERWWESRRLVHSGIKRLQINFSAVEVALKWASTMTWRGVQPIVEFVEGVYERGVTLSGKEYSLVLERLAKSENLKKWSVKITASPVGY